MKIEAPRGWRVSAKDDAVVLEEPGRELFVAFVAVRDSDTERATREAWQRVRPGFAREVRASMPTGPADGWEGTRTTAYAVDDDEARSVAATAYLFEGRTFVRLEDGTEAALDRRGSQLDVLEASFDVVGHLRPREESWVGRAADLSPAKLAALDAFLARVTKKAGVPGAAIAVVQGGAVVYERAFGTKVLGSDDPITTRTLFQIGSTTKPLMTLMMARLVDEGKFGWDTPVTRVYPTFAVGDPETTRRLVMQDMVCACTGIPRRDTENIVLRPITGPRALFEWMRTVRPTTGLGEAFQYSNEMVQSAGYVAAHAALPDVELREAFARVMQSRVFDPLGMHATTLDPELVLRRDHASPHGQELRPAYAPLAFDEQAALFARRGPRGGVWSSVDEMSAYVALELAATKRGDANVLARRVPRVRASHEIAYALGLMRREVHGLVEYGHGGNTIGFTSDMFFVPQKDVGVVWLSNGGGANELRNAVHDRFYELAFERVNDGVRENASAGGAQAADTVGDAERELDQAVSDRRVMVEVMLKGLVPYPEAARLTGVVGTYADPEFGELTVRLVDGRLRLDLGGWSSEVVLRGAEPHAVLMALDGMHRGEEYLVGERKGRKTISLVTPQRHYVFEQVVLPAFPASATR
jgi:CubicO group peptidase (beta-lactamase class C family)